MEGKSFTSRFSLTSCSWLVIFVLLGFLALFLVLKTNNKVSFNPKALAQGVIECSPDYNPADPDLDFTFSIDREEYAVGDTVFMISEGNECGVELMITIARPDGTQDTKYIITDAYGNFYYEYVLGDIEGEYVVDVHTADGITVLGSNRFHASIVTVTTDKSDYSPGENVIITGSGWQPGEPVEFNIVEEPLIHDPETLSTIADESRNIFNDEYVIQEHDVGQAFTLYATGIDSGLTALTTFTDHLQLFFSSFGSTNGDDVGAVDSWVESDDNDGNDCRITDGSPRSGSTTAQHARLCGCAITRTVPTTGHNSIQLRYYCRGDSDAESTEKLNVFVDLNGNGLFTDAGENVASHTIDDEDSSCPDDGWSSQKVISLPAAADDDANFKIRFVSTTNDCTTDDGNGIEEPRVDDVEVAGVDIPVCGDSIVGTGESCDDGNTVNGDGCSSVCATETGYFCTGEPSDCCLIVASFRECFDVGSGDTNCTDDSGQSDNVDSNNAPAWTDGDGSGGSDCAIRNEELRLRSNCAVTQTSISTVGYSNIHLLYLWGADIDSDAGDDGDLVVDWRVTAGSFNPVNTHDLTTDTIPATNSVDFALGAAANNTTIEIRFNGATSEDDDRALVDNVVLCGDAAVCGNGTIDAGETCDDGNTANGDGCSSSCATETGFDCSGNPSVCTPICGDTLIKGTETCDDGNTNNGDCCSSTCQLDANGSSCSDSNACNGAETCQAGSCTAGTPLVCDDGLFCTGTETCDPSSGCTDGPDPSTDDGVSCTTDACDEDTDMITHTPVDSVCNNGQFCDGTETCNVSAGCQDGPDPLTDDGIGCTTDACDEVTDMITHTPVDTVCDDGLFCTGAETCDATLGCQDGADPVIDDGAECTTDSCNEEKDKIDHDPIPDFCSDDILCTDDVCNPEAVGADETTGCTNPFDEEVCFASVTSSSLCLFDVDKSTDGCQFRLILTPDQNSPSAWKLNASNPGQYYYNTFYVGDGDETINITVPYPFVTHGAMPIHIYDSVGGVPSGDAGCYLPGTEIGNSSTQVTMTNFTDTNLNGVVDIGDTYTFPVHVPTVEDGYAYINIHLDYGLKGTNNYTKNAINDAIDATSSAMRIPNLFDYSFDDDSLTAGDTCENTNVFKRDPGIGGLVLKSNGDPATNVKVQIYQGTKLMATVYTDADGWYMWQYKYTGKATTFTVKLPAYNLSNSVTLKSNGYLVVSFTLP